MTGTNGITQTYAETIAQRIMDDITTVRVNGQNVGVAEVTREGTLVTIITEPQFYSANITSLQVLDSVGGVIIDKTPSLEITPNEKISFTESIEIELKGVDA